MYTMEKQLTIGQMGEAYLDDKFSHWWNIEPATKQQQFAGIDRIWTHRRVPQLVRKVEYKTDEKADGTGNIPIEFLSNDSSGSAGWAVKSQADLLYFLLWESKRIFGIPMRTVQEWLPTWMMTGKIKQTPNSGYHTHNVLVSLKDFEALCCYVRKPEQGCLNDDWATLR